MFAVETTAVQLTWRSLPPRTTAVSAGDVTVEVEGTGGPAAVVLEGLPADTELDLVVSAAGTGAVPVGSIRTLSPPPGRELFRLATVNDLHIGGPRFGHLPAARDSGDPADPTSERCLRAALAELAAWGAQLVVVKGDITDHGRPEEWERVADLLAAGELPVLAVPGNHDAQRPLAPAQATFAARGLQLVVGDAEAHDVPGLRVVAADSTIPHRHRGALRPLVDRIRHLLAEAPGPALLAMHHQLQRHRVPTHWPPGIPGPEARPLLDAVAQANPATLVASGHTHRHRTRHHGPLVLSEVGSPKDFPGTWTGYVVHEGGIRQVVRRVATAGAIEWTESTRRTFLGAWGHWSPGTIDQRCFSHTWPSRRGD